MLWIVLLTMTVLAGFAFDWISFDTSRERIVMSINIGKLAPTIRKFREAAFGKSPRRDSLSQRERH